MMEEAVKKMKLNLKESIDLEIICAKMKADILDHMKTIVKKSDDISDLSKKLIDSKTYSDIKNKYENDLVFKTVKFKSCFLKITGDTVNQIMFYNDL